MKGRCDKEFRHPAEARAWEYLSSNHGHILLRHNYHNRNCELDIISLDPAGVIHITEVKAWKLNSLIHPLESFKIAQAQKLRDAAATFLMEAAESNTIRVRLRESGCPDMDWSLASVSFDLIWIHAGSIELYQDILH